MLGIKGIRKLKEYVVEVRWVKQVELVNHNLQMKKLRKYKKRCLKLLMPGLWDNQTNLQLTENCLIHLC